MRRLACGLLLLLLAARASAMPLLALRPGGTPFEGPADGSPTAIWWNPAAIALQSGAHLELDGGLVAHRGSFDRATLDTTTGLPSANGDRAFAPQGLADDRFHYFAGATWDIFSENFRIGFAVHAPWDQTLSLADSLKLPSAYHLVEETWRSIYFTLAIALKLDQRWLIGLAISAVDSVTDLVFYRDTALDGGSPSVKSAGFENPMSAARIHVHGDGGGNIPGVLSGFAPAGIAMNWGLLAHPVERLWMGASWSHVFPLLGHGSGYEQSYEVSSAVGAEVTPAPSAGSPCANSTCVGAADVAWSIPDVFHLGARIMLTEKLELSTWGRLTLYGGYGTSSDPALRGVVIRLSGAPVTRAGMPEQIVLARALVPAFAAEVGLRYRPVPLVRLALSFAGESSAVPAEYVSAAAVDAPKVDVMAGVELRPRTFHLRTAEIAFHVGVSYGITALFPVAPSPGAFDPGARVRCVDARYALDACADDLAGRGEPNAAGRYTLVVHHLTGSAGVHF